MTGTAPLLRPAAAWAAPVLVVGASALAVFHGIGFSVWLDEAFSYGVATSPWHVLLGLWAWGPESNMTLYYVVLKVWLGITGWLGIAPNELVLRLPNLVFAVAAALTTYLIGARLFGRIAGLVGAGLYLTNFLQMILAQMARSYTLELFLLAASWYALFAALESEGGHRARRWWIVFVASAVLAVYAALFSGLVLISQATALVALLIIPGRWRERVRANLRSLIIAFGMVFLLVLPIGIDAALNGGQHWVPPVGLRDVREFFRFLGGDSRSYELLVFGSAMLGGLLTLAARIRPFDRLTRARPEWLGPAVAIACWFLVPLGIAFVFTQPHLNLHLFFKRYLVVVVPPLCLLAGLAVGALRWRLAQAALAALLVFVAVPQLLHYYPYAQVQNVRDPVRWIEQRYQPGDGMICVPQPECAIAIGYYLELDRGPAHFDGDSPGRFSWTHEATVSPTGAAVQEYAARHSRVFFIFAPIGSSPAQKTQEQQLEGMLRSQATEVGRTTARSAVETTVVLYQR